MSIGATRAIASVVGEVYPDTAADVSARLHLGNGLTAEIVRGERDIRRMAGPIDGFVMGCRDAGSWGSAMVWGRDVLAQDGIPLAVLLYRDDLLIAVALGAELTVMGHRTRLGVCGNLTGQRGFYTRAGAAQAEREALVLIAADAFIASGLWGMVVKLRELPETAVGCGPVAFERGLWAHPVGHMRRRVWDTFRPGPSFAESLSVFGARTRRNLRYYRRRVERELGGVFLPAMDGPILRQALVELQAFTDDPVRPGIAKNRIAQIAGEPNSFCMGLRAADGCWLSWISGWRSGKHTYIDWQCNRRGMERYSLSTAMRSFLIEHESLMRQSHIHFLGGTSHSMKYGFREEWCSDWLMTRHAWTAWVLTMAGPMLRLGAKVAGGLGLVEDGRRAAVRRSPAMELMRRIAVVATRVSAK